MKATLVLAALLLTVSPPGWAQRNPSARVRAFAALPDWTGLWQSELAKLFGSNPSGRIEGAEDIDQLRHSKLLEHPPYNVEWEKKYQALLHNSAAMAAAAANAKICGPGGFPMLMDWAPLFQVVVTPEETLFVFEDGAIRHIYTDGRSHPGKDDLWLTPIGDSIGRWEGETLVIDTVARAPGPVMLGPAAELSEQAHFTERVRRLDKNTLQDQMTIVDPLRFAQPWNLTVQYSRVTQMTRMVAWDCGNDRNPVVNGKLTIAPP